MRICGALATRSVFLAALLAVSGPLPGCRDAHVGVDLGIADANTEPPLDCADLPCGRFGECTTDPVLGGVCECLPWRAGRTCEVFDFCFAAPCTHGECVNGEDSRSCVCAAGYTGTDCEEDVDECASANACSGHGTCTNSVGSFSCACDPGFAGDRCEVNTDDCAALNCNTGTCVDEVQRAYCSCPTGFGGASCDVPSETCAAGLCVSGACVDAAGVFDHCDCPAGRTGTYCERSVDDCAGAPCQNGSRCVDGDDAHSCVGCVGFTGANCDTPVTCVGSPPAAPTNGSAGTPTGNTFGATVTYTCDGDFRLTGSATSTCGANGQWSAAPTCECDSHVLTYDLTGDYYIFAPVVAPFRAAAGENIAGINTLPFGPGSITLRVSASGDGPSDGPVSILDMFLPLEFDQHISLTPDTFIDIATDIDVLVPRQACGHASGTLTGDTVVWGACDVTVPGTITNFTPEDSFDPDGVGCFRGYNSAGAITCQNGTNRLLQCVSSGALQPLPAVNIQNGEWDQALVPFVFDSTDLRTASFRVGVPGQDISEITATSLLGTHLLIPNQNPGTATFIALRGTLRDAELCAPAPTGCAP
ncbi:MAG: hypothetical protein H6726_05665 [Sandaracinaceae bacterium]|nr:hypothetical protein [Myxococcales bacterium]MCB9657123.1 hypothetical protein [Sandaracinaceae bacterium]